LKILVDEVTMYNLSIIVLPEVRWPGKGNVKSGNHTIFYSGTENNRHENGVNILINDSILPNVKTFTAINKRLYIARIKGKM
jgi:hypothetical protein